MDTKAEIEGLRAQITVQAVVIETLLEACFAAGLMKPETLVDKLERFEEAPTAICVDPKYNAAFKQEIGGWADMLYEQHMKS